MTATFSRRRVMTLLGAAAGLPLLGADAARERAVLYRWNGSSLGSPSRILLYHHDEAAAARVLSRAAEEIERLERVFALYRPDSELARLNRDGQLEAPSLDLLTVLSLAQHVSALSEGAFDVTVQPLWDLYAAHFFGTASPDPNGPSRESLEGALRRIDWRGVAIERRRIVLTRAAAAVTLNGIAQGYVADRVAETMMAQGCRSMLADLGRSEIRSLGAHADGRPWRVGLCDPRHPDTVAETLTLRDRAVCTSGGYGTRFDASGRFHHLFDPASGTSASRYIGVSVTGPSAMVADALSTALYVAAPRCQPALLAAFPEIEARLTRADGVVVVL